MSGGEGESVEGRGRKRVEGRVSRGRGADGRGARPDAVAGVSEIAGLYKARDGVPPVCGRVLSAPLSGHGFGGLLCFGPAKELGDLVEEGAGVGGFGEVIVEAGL